MKKELASLVMKAVIHIGTIVELDKTPLILEKDTLARLSDKAFKHLKQKRYPPPPQTYSTDAACIEARERVTRSLAALGFHGVTIDDLNKLRFSDKYDTELRIMADTRAYWLRAYQVSRYT